jgi:hypothetical protein
MNPEAIQGTDTDAAWNAVRAAYPAAGAAWDDDDEGMRESGDGALSDWAADLEDRVGLDVGDFRAALFDFMEARAMAQLVAAGLTPERNAGGNWIIGGREWSDILIEARDGALPAWADGYCEDCDDDTRSNGPRL